MSKTQLGKVSIIGTGKGAQALAQGLLNAGFSNREIEVVRREDFKIDSDLTFFYKNKIKVRKCMQTIYRSRYIFVVVTPSGAGDIVKRMSEVKFCQKFKYDIISFVSGLEPYIVEKNITMYDNISWVYATYNINIAYNKGIICATEHLPIFDELGFFVKEDFEGVQKSIVTVGTMNALLAKGLLIAYKQDSDGMYIRDWIKEFYEVVLDPIKMNDNLSRYHDAHFYLSSLMEVITSPILFYKYDQAYYRVRLAAQSLLLTFLSIEDLSESTFDHIINKVATKGGCTEKGINQLNTDAQINDSKYLEENIFIPIVLAANKFPKIVSDSLV